MQQEKRKHIRYSGKCIFDLLEISVSRPGIREFLKLSPTVQCLDFSLSGLQISSDQHFYIGQKLIIDFLLRDIELIEISAVVITCNEGEPGKFSVGSRFCFSSPRMQDPIVKHALLQIEARCKAADEFPILNVK
ncbi:MAG: PilZ domain-containing protein [Pseudomonadales bacterium]|nr:PilZ domain-containing protein [Pseudomonadales bacterium]